MRFSTLLHGSGTILAHAQCACKLPKAHALDGLDPAMHPFQSSCRPWTRSRSARDDLRTRATRSFAMIADVRNARKYYAMALDLASEGDGQRPEIAEAKAYIHAHPH
jgi:hypothetical protein